MVSCRSALGWALHGSSCLLDAQRHRRERVGPGRASTPRVKQCPDVPFCCRVPADWHQEQAVPRACTARQGPHAGLGGKARRLPSPGPEVLHEVAGRRHRGEHHAAHCSRGSKQGGPVSRRRCAGSSCRMIPAGSRVAGHEHAQPPRSQSRRGSPARPVMTPPASRPDQAAKMKMASLPYRDLYRGVWEK